MTIWQHLTQQIQTHSGRHFSINSHQPVVGGDVNQAFQVTGESNGAKQSYFVKLNAAGLGAMFEQEMLGLKALALSKAIKVPEVICFGEFEQYSYLVLEYLNMGQRGDIADFARALANLHLTTQPAFGFASNNFIGKTPQENQWCDNWGDFFASRRLSFQLDILEKQGVSSKLINSGRKLLPQVSDLLNQHRPEPALVHGDLWSGNHSFVENGEPVIYDPAVYYGDCEVDLAMLELFGNPGRSFFDAYQQINPIKPGYPLRKQIYNLYHILNHANAFAGSYLDQSQWLIDDIEGQL